MEIISTSISSHKIVSPALVVLVGVGVNTGTSLAVSQERFINLQLSGSGSGINLQDGFVYETPVASFDEMLNTIRDVFGLSIKGLSEVLNITRPTLYSWIKGNAVASSDDNKERVLLLFLLAQKTKSVIGDRAGIILSKIFVDGVDLGEILKSRTLNSRLFEEYLEKVLKSPAYQVMLASLKEKNNSSLPAIGHLEFDIMTGKHRGYDDEPENRTRSKE